jgi:uncharacterized protein (DUF952 family)
MSEHLYRVVSLAQWREGEATGLVPRCAADQRHDRVHLNRREEVERAADLWFSVDEQPVALEIDMSEAGPALRWEMRVEPPLEVWPNLYVPALPTRWVVAVHELVHDARRGGFSLADSAD